ncbi:hypothetical protein PSTT_15821 [Puccinia striiformis]|uniref:Protein kinase domain-containing protein n=1 Tax=Puccinia striiformis TaxID=27350 RepID=A0A2S4UFR6_9BASI|nr:hypothetical protein PSTT_15821 [Puccinia striiformis]
MSNNNNNSNNLSLAGLLLHPQQTTTARCRYSRLYYPQGSGDGSFGTVWLADWHSPLTLPPGTQPPGPSSRAEYKGKQLVAVKKMKKTFDGGWEECMKLKNSSHSEQFRCIHSRSHYTTLSYIRQPGNYISFRMYGGKLIPTH